MRTDFWFKRNPVLEGIMTVVLEYCPQFTFKRNPILKWI